MTVYAKQQRAVFSSDKTDWETPQAFFDEVNAEFDFTLDAAASSANAKCPRYFTEAEDGLSQSWGGQRVWINPPYGRGDNVGLWVRTAATKMTMDSHPPELVVLLVPARTDTKWFHEYALPRAEIRFIKGRLKFVGAPFTAPFPCMLVIFRRENKK